MLSITKKFRFEAAHAILNYEGLCKNIHGHSYELLVTVCGPKDAETQMVMDFKQLKSIVNDAFLAQADHALFLNQNHPRLMELETYMGKKFLMDGEPTAENMVETIASLVRWKLPAGIKLKRLRLFETESSFVDWEPDY